MTSLRAAMAVLSLFLFAAFFFSLEAAINFLHIPQLNFLDFTNEGKKTYNFPDFDKYHHTRKIAADELSLDDTDGRIIIIGDIHGRNDSFHDLLSTVPYSAERDTLILAGDFLAKSTPSGSLAILDFLLHSQSRVYAVRGNHDQMVIQWRAWRDWFEPLKIAHRSGADFLATIEAEWEHQKRSDTDANEWAENARKHAAGTWRAKWWLRIPLPGSGRTKNQWSLFSEHYWLARDMTRGHAELLFSMSSVLHIHSAHMFVAHAGILPFDPRREPTDDRQPLAHMPRLKKHLDEGSQVAFSMGQRVSEETLRILQEQALLNDIRDNRDPWVLMNMRSVKENGRVTRDGDKGTPWSELWNDQMGRCSGFGFDDDLSNSAPLQPIRHATSFATLDDAATLKTTLPCHPSTVVYGHAASRGLDIKRWTMGLDTGCMYGGKLTALVLQRRSFNNFTDGDSEEVDDADEEDAKAHYDCWPRSRSARSRTESRRHGQQLSRPWRKRIKFGDARMNVRAELVSIGCP